jgi:hypothetical protein
MIFGLVPRGRHRDGPNTAIPREIATRPSRKAAALRSCGHEQAKSELAVPCSARWSRAFRPCGSGCWDWELLPWPRLQTFEVASIAKSDATYFWMECCGEFGAWRCRDWP